MSEKYPSKDDIHSKLNYKFLGYFSDKILDYETVDIIIKYFNENDSDLFFLEFGGKFHRDRDDTAFPWRKTILYFELSKIWPVFKGYDIIYNKRGSHICEKVIVDGPEEQNIPDFTSYLKTAHELNKQYKESYVNVPNDTLSNYEKAYYGKNRKRLQHIKHKYDKDNFFNFSQSIKE